MLLPPTGGVRAPISGRLSASSPHPSQGFLSYLETLKKRCPEGLSLFSAPMTLPRGNGGHGKWCPMGWTGVQGENNIIYFYLFIY